MTIREIITVPHDVLRMKAKRVTAFDQEFRETVDDMVETMREAPGVGLAATQIGLLQRIVVIEYPENDEEDSKKKLYVLANPEIVEYSEEKEFGIEGCLSVPGLVGEVERSLRITVKGQNKQGKNIKLKLENWVARVFQHEIDHLDGVLYTDRAIDVWKPTEEEAAAIRD